MVFGQWHRQMEQKRVCNHFLVVELLDDPSWLPCVDHQWIHVELSSFLVWRILWVFIPFFWSVFASDSFDWVYSWPGQFWAGQFWLKQFLKKSVLDQDSFKWVSFVGSVMTGTSLAGSVLDCISFQWVRFWVSQFFAGLVMIETF